MPAHSHTETFTTSDDCLISYRLRPSRDSGAPRLVLIHPLALDGTIWDTIADKLAYRASILTYDCRGHGCSSRKSMPFTIGLFARDLAELLDHVGWPIATIAGCSMGGCVALGFSGMYPARLNGLGLIDTTAWYGQHAPERWRERAATAHAKGLAAMIEFQETRWFSDSFRARHPEVVNGVNKIFLANDIECYGATCVMLGDADLRPFESSIRVPVAVVVGAEDYATPLAMSQQMHESITGSTLTVLSGLRHLTPVEAPEQIAAQLVALLDRSVEHSLEGFFSSTEAAAKTR
jgi:3-oxoadipate enol-lactonase